MQTAVCVCQACLRQPEACQHLSKKYAFCCAHRDGYNKGWYSLYGVVIIQLACTLFKTWFIRFRVLTTYLPVNALKYATHIKVHTQGGSEAAALLAACSEAYDV